MHYVQDTSSNSQENQVCVVSKKTMPGKTVRALVPQREEKSSSIQPAV